MGAAVILHMFVCVCVCVWERGDSHWCLFVMNLHTCLTLTSDSLPHCNVPFKWQHDVSSNFQTMSSLTVSVTSKFFLSLFWLPPCLILSIKKSVVQHGGGFYTRTTQMKTRYCSYCTAIAPTTLLHHTCWMWGNLHVLAWVAPFSNVSLIKTIAKSFCSTEAFHPHVWPPLLLFSGPTHQDLCNY